MTPPCKNKVTKTKNLITVRVQEFFSSDTDAAAGAAATAAATAAASAAAFVFTTVFTVVATVAAAEAAAVAAAVAAAPAAASVSEEKNSWTLNIIRFLVFVTLFLHGGVVMTMMKKTMSFQQEPRASYRPATFATALGLNHYTPVQK